MQNFHPTLFLEKTSNTPSHFCHNLNIEFLTKCEVQRPMRSKVCLSVKHTLTNGGECKG